MKLQAPPKRFANISKPLRIVAITQELWVRRLIKDITIAHTYIFGGSTYLCFQYV